ncbi:hypothetical protein ACFQ1I_13795 [Kitasatospora arboriphila]
MLAAALVAAAFAVPGRTVRMVPGGAAAREPSPSRSDSPNVCFQFSAEDFPSSQPFFTVRPTS